MMMMMMVVVVMVVVVYVLSYTIHMQENRGKIKQ
jgi:hypothetical protein